MFSSSLSAPQPLPESLWGDRWRFAALPAEELEAFFRHRPLPILQAPSQWLPLNLGLASTLPIPGVVIEGGRRSRRLAQWLADREPISIQAVPGELGGLILVDRRGDRWILATFNDSDVMQATHLYQQRQQASQGLHFLLIQPDDTGITYTGFWLLKP